MNKNDRTVMVAMSGGVDSSVAAALLRDQGYRVVGATMLLWDGEAAGVESGCCGTQDLVDARAVCARLGINHYGIDLREEFRREVVEPFAMTYLRGRTPNPCILCNERLKFHYLLRKAREVGARWLATGHYARIEGRGPFRLCRGTDRSKDQSYFLFPVDQEILAHLIFPLGNLTKDEVRDKAGELRLAVHEKPESQEVCFIPPDGLKDFLREASHDEIVPGPLLDTAGNVIGSHDGFCFYTIGQRKGLGVAAAKPLYVTRIDAAGNTIVLGTREEASFPDMLVESATWVAGQPPSDHFRAQVQVRHRHRPAEGEVRILEGGSFRVFFDEPQHGVAPGQAAVVYDGDTVLGGGWISGSEPNVQKPIKRD
ncbi:MAG: tRNA 2-thiouridine(34) synthase MnmA [bacterium]|nr:MAG: tRNA 2-thiouridine(34) synthase MnmA [bacterium]